MLRAPQGATTSESGELDDDQAYSGRSTADPDDMSSLENADANRCNTCGDRKQSGDSAKGQNAERRKHGDPGNLCSANV